MEGLYILIYEALISCAFAFAYAKSMFSHNVAQMMAIMCVGGGGRPVIGDRRC